MVARIARVCCSTALAAPLLVATPAASGAPYSVEHGPFQAAPRFAVRYSGSGSWRTLYHSEPPNDGGDHDTNDVDDSSTQRWQLLYRGALVVPRCKPARK